MLIDIAKTYKIKLGICSFINVMLMGLIGSSILWRTKFQYNNGETANIVYGDKYCQYNKCLNNLSLSEAEEFCNVCEDKDTCTFYFQTKL